MPFAWRLAFQPCLWPKAGQELAANRDWLHVNRIAVHPTNPNILSNLTASNSGGRKEIAWAGTTAYASVDNAAGSAPAGGSGQIWADPADNRHVIGGGLDLWESFDGAVLFAIAKHPPGTR